MPIKIYNPTSAGRRNASVLDYRAVITKDKPEKSLTRGKRRAHGRNHHGVITAKHRGGGNKKLYRIIDFKRRKDGVPRLGAKEGDWSVIILPSGEMRRVRSACRATIGQLGNLDWINVTIGKAGRNRHRGVRPHTRAKAMNPIDHPLGGGEGRSNGGPHPLSKTGVPAKGGITRSKKKHSEKLILRRRKFGKHQVRPQTVNV